MSTSDPHRPGGATDGPDETPADESTSSIEETTPAVDDSPAHTVAPTVETLDPLPPSTPETPTEPVAGTIDAELPATTSTSTVPAADETTGASEPNADTGRHAVVRPAPTPPDEPATVAAAPVETPPDPVRSTPTTPPEDHDQASPAPVAEPVAATPETATPVTAPPATAPLVAPALAPMEAMTPAPAAEDDDRLFPDPNAPRSTSVGSHILGVIVGLILAPIGVAVLLLGESRILQAQVDGWDASTEVLGIVLVTLGLLLLGCVLLLALWTPAVPITGGAILTLAGIVYLYVPSLAREQTLNVLSSSGWRLTVTQVTVAGTSGMVLAAGFLLLLAGIVAGVARRRGARLGEFRERHRI